jgi:hypothetical protein
VDFTLFFFFGSVLTLQIAIIPENGSILKSSAKSRRNPKKKKKTDGEKEPGKTWDSNISFLFSVSFGFSGAKHGVERLFECYLDFPPLGCRICERITTWEE